MRSAWRVGTLLLMLPLLLWLLLLILLPHLDMLTVSLRERVAFGEYRFSWMHYQAFFSESLYWRTFLRTALMSILATFLTLVIAFRSPGISPNWFVGEPVPRCFSPAWCHFGSVSWCGPMAG